MSYGRWLVYLDKQGKLDSDAAPFDRATPEAVASFVERLKMEVRPSTLRTYIKDLCRALQVMEPDREWVWLLIIVSQIWRANRPSKNTTRVVPADRLYALGFELMETADRSNRFAFSSAFLPFHASCLLPKPCRLGDRVDLALLPPAFLVAKVVGRSMMRDAERHRPLVACLAAHCPRLRMADVVRLAWHAPAHQARLGRDKSQVILVAYASRFRGGNALAVDAAGTCSGSGLLIANPRLLCKLL